MISGYPPMVLHRLKLLFVVFCALCAASGWVMSGQDTTVRVQPIPFSHRIHIAEAKLDCVYCHANPEKFGVPVGIPDAPECLECHAYSAPQTPTLGQLNGFAEKKQPIPWVRIFSLKDFVFFDHRYHMMNGAQCEGCHGPIGTEDIVSDRLSTTNMAFCQPCHVKTGAKTGCNTCHDPR